MCIRDSASTVHGAGDASTLSQRVAREVWESFSVDHLGIGFFEHQSAIAVQGGVFPLLESMTFDEGPGLSGWKSAGGPELVFEDARQDERAPRETALKHRVGSYAVLPIEYEGEVVGRLTAGTHRALGIDHETLSAMRIVAAELGQAYGRVKDRSSEPTGLATPVEFHEAVKAASEGHFVYLDVLKRDEAIEAFGRPALEKAVRQLGHRLRSLLPPGGLICRRPEGDFVAFLKTTDEEIVRRWAAHAGVTASLVTLNALDGRSRVPMAIRAKVALYAPHSHRISREAGR